MAHFDHSDSDSDNAFSPQRSSSHNHMSGTAHKMTTTTKRSSLGRQPRMLGSASMMKSTVRRASLERREPKKKGSKPSLERKTKDDEPAILMITCGVTGAGKSTLIHETFRALLGKVPEFEMFLVDDLVENDPQYKKLVDEIVGSKICKPPFDKECQPTEELLAAFKSAYFAVRSKEGCMGNTENLNCNELNDRNIIRALQAHKHVVIESTCSYIPAWILDLELTNYKIVFSYSVVRFDVLLERNESRASKNLKAYYEDRSKPGPRVIDIRPSTFLPIVTQVWQTLVDLRNVCMGPTASKDGKCMSKKSQVSNATVSNLFVFDNTGANFKKIYDHQNAENAKMTDYQFQVFLFNAFFGPNF